LAEKGSLKKKAILVTLVGRDDAIAAKFQNIPCVNFIIIFRARFLYEFLVPSQT